MNPIQELRGRATSKENSFWRRFASSIKANKQKILKERSQVDPRWWSFSPRKMPAHSTTGLR